MDRDLKIGLIVLLIAIATALTLTPDSLNRCLQKGAEALNHSTFATAEDDKWRIFLVCNKQFK